MLLVHDVWHTPAHLRGLRARLAQAGWRVYAPALPGHSLGASWGSWPDAAVDALVAAIDRHPEPVTVVAHGWGAAVASAAAARVPSVRQIIYVCGVLPTAGPRSLWDETAPHLRRVIDQGRDPGRGVIAPPDVAAWWRWWVRPPISDAADVPSTLVRRAHAALVPAPVTALTGRVDLTEFYALTDTGAIPTAYLVPVDSDAYGARYRWREFAACLGRGAVVRDLPGEYEQVVLRPAAVARAVHAAAAGLAPWQPPPRRARTAA
jgi:pimeloyl-ACP methyl ester carboxylesterase